MLAAPPLGVNTRQVDLTPFNKLSDELLDGESFVTLLEAKVLFERWRVRYNTVRPHSSLGNRPPAKVDSRRLMSPFH
jgi:hypothetical protein